MPHALLVIDMQNYFFRGGRGKKQLDRLTENINALIRTFDRYGCPVYRILTVHKADQSTWDLGMLKSGKNVLIAGTQEAQELAGLSVSAAHPVITKTRLSAFIRTELEARLKEQAVDTVTVCGVYTHGCVGRSAIDARELDFHVVIARQCVFSHRKRLARMMLNQLRRAFDMELLGNAQIIDRISKETDTMRKG